MTLPDPPRLNGWKEIATHLGRGVRTAQRWEQQLGLPVRRIKTPQGGEIVFAVATEIDEWLASTRPTEGVEPSSESDLEAAIEPQPPSSRPLVPWTTSLSAALLLVTITGAAWLAWPKDAGSARAPTVVRAETPASTDRAWARAGLDPGPWPTEAHDSARSGQSHLKGPDHPAEPQLVAEIGKDADPPVVVRSDGVILVGGVGAVHALAPYGRELWASRLNDQSHGFREIVSGLTLASSGLMVVSTTQYPPSDDIHRVTLYGLGADGRRLWEQRQVPTYRGPAVSPNGDVFQMDSFSMLAAFRGGGRTWMVHLPGFGASDIAQDSAGHLLIGTSGSTYGMPSLWSISPAGKVLWHSGDGRPLGLAVGSHDDAWTLDRQGSILARYDSAGRQLWAVSTRDKIRGFNAMALDREDRATIAGELGIMSFGADGSVRWVYQPHLTSQYDPRPEVEGCIVADAAGNIYASALGQVSSLTPDGTLRWSVEVNKPGRLLVSGDHELLVVSDARRLYRIRDRVPGISPREITSTRLPVERAAFAR